MISERLRTLITPSVDADVRLRGVSLFLGKVLDKFDTRLGSLEERQLQKGDKGDKGDKGETGSIGPAGASGIRGPVGPVGAAGPAGKDGKNGKDGAAVVDANVDIDGHLVMKLSTGKIIDAGEIIQNVDKMTHLYSKSLQNPQITVSLTAPSNPQINDLWYDIS